MAPELSESGTNKRTWLLFAIIMVTAVAIRLPLLFGPVLGEDAAYHARAAVTVLNGGFLYRDVPYTYPPLYAYTEAASIAVLGDTAVGWRMVPEVCDLGVIVLVFLIASRVFGLSKALVVAILYVSSPLPVIAASSFASFDSAAVFWMLASILLLFDRKQVPSAVALGVGAAYKYFPIILLPPLLLYVADNRRRILYGVVSIVAVALFQVPFIITDFAAWLDNVILYHASRPAFGVSIYNLLRLNPTLGDVRSPLTLLFPVSLLLTFLLVAFNRDNSELGVLKKTSTVMLVAVFFNKVVLFYALWFIPLICLLFLEVKKRKTMLLLLASLFTLQMSLYLTWYFSETSAIWSALAMAYVYLVSSALLLVCLLRDQLLSTKKRLKNDRYLPDDETYKRNSSLA